MSRQSDRLCSLALWAGLLTDASGAENPHRVSFTVGSTPREALIYAPSSAKETPSPVVMVFHGHGGTAAAAAKNLAIHSVWPEAICVYPQGLPTPGRLFDLDGKQSGWQMMTGAQGDRDLQLFDGLLGLLKFEYQVDAQRIYVTGHSNGGAFAYLLLAERGSVLAVVAASAGATPEAIPKIKPKPVMHIAGHRDNVVKFTWQQAALKQILAIDGCETTGQPWAPDCTLFESASGTPVVAYIHSGGHIVPRGAANLIVRFFQENPLR